jgi:ribosome-binding ATPase YchF (GTP1/OBG family)
VDPCRDLGIISDEVRIKDMEFVEKHLEAVKKITGRGGQSLEIKAKKEEQNIVEKVLKHLQEEKDVRKGDWNNKEVTTPPFLVFVRLAYGVCDDNESQTLLIPARRVPLKKGDHEIPSF